MGSTGENEFTRIVGYNCCDMEYVCAYENEKLINRQKETIRYRKSLIFGKAHCSNRYMSNYSILTEDEQNSAQGRLEFRTFGVGISSFLAIIVNLFVAWSTCIPFGRFRGKKTSTILIACLAIDCALTAFFLMFRSGTSTSIINLNGWFCKAASFSKHTGQCAFSAFLGGIVLNRIQDFREHQRRRMALLWVITCSSVSIVFNIPVLFTVVYAEKIRGGHVEGFCKQVPLLDSVTLTIIYQTTILLIFDIGLASVMIWAISKLEQKVAYLRAISPVFNDSLRRKAKSIKLVKCYLCTFVFVWLPLGFFKWWRRISSRWSISDNAIPNISVLLVAFSCAGFICATFTPMLSLYCLDQHFATMVRRQFYRLRTFMHIFGVTAHASASLLESTTDTITYHPTLEEPETINLEPKILGRGGEGQQLLVYETTKDTLV